MLVFAALQDSHVPYTTQGQPLMFAAADSWRGVPPLALARWLRRDAPDASL